VGNKSWLSALAVLAAASAGSAHAAVTEDNFLLRHTGDLIALCSSGKSDPMYTAATNFCHGFAVGVFRVLREVDTARRSSPFFCMPDPQPSRNEGIANFLQWASADPKRADQPPQDAIAAFLAQQYPCPRKH
jgi:hypothetical protein